MPFIFKLAANFLMELVVNCAKEDFQAVFTFLHSGTIRMNSHNKLDLCFSIALI